MDNDLMARRLRPPSQPTSDRGQPSADPPGQPSPWDVALTPDGQFAPAEAQSPPNDPPFAPQWAAPNPQSRDDVPWDRPDPEPWPPAEQAWSGQTDEHRTPARPEWYSTDGIGDAPAPWDQPDADTAEQRRDPDDAFAPVVADVQAPAPAAWSAWSGDVDFNGSGNGAHDEADLQASDVGHDIDYGTPVSPQPMTIATHDDQPSAGDESNAVDSNPLSEWAAQDDVIAPPVSDGAPVVAEDAWSDAPAPVAWPPATWPPANEPPAQFAGEQPDPQPEVAEPEPEPNEPPAQFAGEQPDPQPEVAAAWPPANWPPVPFAAEQPDLQAEVAEPEPEPNEPPVQFAAEQPFPQSEVAEPEPEPKEPPVQFAAEQPDPQPEVAEPEPEPNEPPALFAAEQPDWQPEVAAAWPPANWPRVPFAAEQPVPQPAVAEPEPEPNAPPVQFVAEQPDPQPEVAAALEPEPSPEPELPTAPPAPTSTLELSTPPNTRIVAVTPSGTAQNMVLRIELAIVEDSRPPNPAEAAKRVGPVRDSEGRTSMPEPEYIWDLPPDQPNQPQPVDRAYPPQPTQFLAPLPNVWPSALQPAQPPQPPNLDWSLPPWFTPAAPQARYSPAPPWVMTEPTPRFWPEPVQYMRPPEPQYQLPYRSYGYQPQAAWPPAPVVDQPNWPQQMPQPVQSAPAPGSQAGTGSVEAVQADRFGERFQQIKSNSALTVALTVLFGVLVIALALAFFQFATSLLS